MKDSPFKKIFCASQTQDNQNMPQVAENSFMLATWMLKAGLKNELLISVHFTIFKD